MDLPLPLRLLKLRPAAEDRSHAPVTRRAPAIALAAAVPREEVRSLRRVQHREEPPALGHPLEELAIRERDHRVRHLAILGEPPDELVAVSRRWRQSRDEKGVVSLRRRVRWVGGRARGRGAPCAAAVRVPSGAPSVLLLSSHHLVIVEESDDEDAGDAHLASAI